MAISLSNHNLLATLLVATFSGFSSQANEQVETHFANTIDVQVQELLAPESLTALRSGGLARFNLMLTNPDVRDSIRTQRSQVQSPDSTLRAKLESYVPSEQSQRRALAELGQSLENKGRAIYYPFGGADVQTPLILDAAADDVFLQTADEFGGAKDLAKLSKLGEHGRVGGYWGNFDSYRDLHLMQAENGIQGTGFQTIARIQRHLDAEVVGVYPMSLTEVGQVEFIGEAANRSTVSHALVVIKDNKTGKLRRVWQFRHDITGKDERFLKFMKRVKFGTMLIKAAPSMMFTGDKKVAAFKVLEPASMNRATVISDVRIADSGFGSKGDLPQPVFRQSYRPKNVSISGAYGYSKKLVYLANGADLISPEGAERGEVPFGAPKAPIVSPDVSPRVNSTGESVARPRPRGEGFWKACSDLFARLL